MQSSIPLLRTLLRCAVIGSETLHRRRARPSRLPSAQLLKTQPTMRVKRTTFRQGRRLAWMNNLAVSLWRSIELNVWLESAACFARPMIDVGTGDGAFASLIFDRVDVALDYDLLSLQRFPRRLSAIIVQADASSGLPLPAESLPFVFSNSVIEHIPSPQGVLDEAARVLAAGGVLAFTVPTAYFSDYLSDSFGTAYAAEINRRLVHRNLYRAEEWAAMMRRAGFDLVTHRYYFSPRGVEIYRILGIVEVRRYLEPALGRRLFQLLEAKLFDWIEDSLRPMTEGAGVLMIGHKP